MTGVKIRIKDDIMTSELHGDIEMGSFSLNVFNHWWDGKINRLTEIG